MTADNPIVISLTHGCVRVASVPTWDEARAYLTRDITDKYASAVHGVYGDTYRRRRDTELAQVASEPAGGRITVAAEWSWATDIRTAIEGEHGLTVGDLAYLHDVHNGSLGWWTIDVKCKIVAVDPITHRVTAVITDRSAVQFRAGNVAVVHADRIRRRPVTGGR